VTGRDRIVVIVVGVLVAIAASWMLVISPKRDEASKLQGQISSIQSSLSSAQSQVSAGEAARNAFRSSYSTMVRLGEAVPTDDNVPSLIFQLQSAAKAAGVDFRGLTLNPAAGGTTAPTTPTPPTGTTGATGATGAVGPAAAGTTPAIGSATGVLPPGAAVGPAGFPVEPFTFTFQGNFFHLSDFFGRLQRFVVADNKRVSVSGRLLSLDAISLAPGSAGFPQIAATVSATTYLLPSTEGLLAGATPAGPAAGTSQPVSSPATSSPSSTPPVAVATPGAGG
jgi:type II secretory pathway pseudopilin PulG